LAGKLATKDHIKQATKEYTVQTDYMGNKIMSRRLKVHREIEELIPLVSWKIYKPLQMAKLKLGMEEIIGRNRFGDLDAVHLSSSSSLATTDCSSETLVPEDIQAWEKIIENN
jgi:hypothetical protein